MAEPRVGWPRKRTKLEPQWRRVRELAEREYGRLDEELRAKVRYRVNVLTQEEHLPAAMARQAIDEAGSGGRLAKQILWRSTRTAAARLGTVIGSDDPAALIVRDLIDRARAAPATACPECGVGSGQHEADCSLVDEGVTA